MKKPLLRILTLALTAILALGILPLGTLSHAADIQLDTILIDAKNPTYHDIWNNSYPLDSITVSPGTTLKANDYAPQIIYNGVMYDFRGFVKFKQYNEAYTNFHNTKYPTPPTTQEGWLQYAKDLEELQKSLKVDFNSSDLKIPGANATLEEWNKWYEQYTATIAAYSLHQHKLSYWYFDDNNHWRECLVCKHYKGFEQPFLQRNWHFDGDGDRICNVCGADIPYHSITVVDSKGGTISVELTEAPYREKIYATVTPDEGYKLKKIHFIKVRDDGSEQEITRRKDGKRWWCLQPTHDLKITAEFVKK